MRAILFLVAALVVAMTMTVAAGVTDFEPVRLEVNYALGPDTDIDWQTLSIAGTDIELTARFVGEIQSGFTSQGEPSLYATIVPDKEDPDLVFSEAVHGTVYWGPKAHNLFKGSYAQTDCEFEADRRGGKIVFFLPLKPEKFKIISYYPPESAGEIVSIPTTIPDGEYLRLYWRGEYVDDPIPVIDPRFPVRWEHIGGAPLHFSRLLYQWELWGEERGNNATKGVLQPAIPLGSAPAGQELMLQIDPIPPAGEITLYLLNRGISIFQSGCCPRLEMRICQDGKEQSAILTRHNGEWIWLGD